MYQLKPCPFCGQAAVTVTWLTPTWVGCNNSACPVKPKARSTDDNLAVRKWNTRADDPPTSPSTTDS